MRILVTADNEFTGDNLTIGSYYFCEQDDTGTLQQNSLFHALLGVFYKSGCYSYPVNSYIEFRNYVKEHLGAGVKRYVFIEQTKNGMKKGQCKNKENIPANIAIDETGEKMLWKELLSWSDYSRKQRKETIDRLISEMLQVGINTPKFNEILQGLENSKMEKVA